MELDFASMAPREEDVTSPDVPSFLLAADNHNLGNDGTSWFDPSTWGEKAVNAAKFTGVSLASGVNSFYNTAVAVNNWFGGELEKNDTAEWISDLDDDLGQYYSENREAADLVGFIATSMIPGTAAVKVFNAGQKALMAARAGEVGSNMGRATGLLVPDVAKYTKLAATDLAQSSATFSALNANTLKALGAGAGQAALESVVFETAVAATMFKSPILEDMDVGDIVKNIAVGTALGGVIGGAFTGAKTFSAIKKEVTAADKLEKPWTHVNEYPGVSASDRIIGRFDDLETMRAVDFPADVEAKMLGKLERLAGEKETKLMNLARQDVHTLTKAGDSELGNMVADSLVGMESRQVMNNLLHAKEIARVGGGTSIESSIRKALADLNPEATKHLRVGYVKAFGEGAGGVSYGVAPKVLNLADTVKNSEEVLTKVQKYGFKLADKFSDLTKVGKHLDAEARYIWADKIARVKSGADIGHNDIPMLERALADLQEKTITEIKVTAADGSKVSITNTQELFELVKETKDRVAEELIKGGKHSTEEIAKIVNVRKSYLEGVESSDIADDLLARQSDAKRYTEQMIEKGRWSADKGLIDISTKPSYFKLTYDTAPLQGIDEHVVDGMALIKAKAKVYQQAVDRVFTNQTEDLGGRFWHPDEKLILESNRYGAGPGLVSFANGNYHSLESWSESIGSATNALIQKRVKDVSESLDSVVYKLANKPEAAIEFEAINNKIAATTEKYVLNADGTALVPRKLVKYQEQLAMGKNPQAPKLQEGAPVEIPIKHAETAEAVAAHIRLKGGRTQGFKELRAAQGLEDSKDIGTFYPIRPNPKDYPHFAFVVDNTVTGGASGHMSMVHATSERELEALIAKVPQPYKTITKAQSEEYHKALNDYQYERTLHENYIDSDMKSRGINTAFFQKTDPQKIARDLLEEHVRGERVFARELVNAKFEKEFSELRRLGEQYTNVSASRYGGTVKAAESSTKNPYLNYVKTALDISQMNEHPLLEGFNTLADKVFSRAVDAVSSTFHSIKSPDELDKVNKLLQENGVKTAFYDAGLEALANHSAHQGALKNFVSKANSLIATLVLRLDPFNAINNAVGAQVLLGAETRSVLRAIESGNTAVAGELAQLAKVKVPGTDDLILSPSKLIGSSIARYFGPQKKELLENYKKHGWVTSISDQFESMLDDITLRGGETEGELTKRIQAAFGKAKKLGDAGEKWTGNKLAEEFNRFIAADVMKQITDLGIKAGVIEEKAALSYINTFVNRTQGNILASQRPLMFQGAVGQAIGLFQTYQFNLIQQLLRYVGEGSKKDVAALLGLQGTLYGMNGLPAFNFINQHIVGTASGNPQHKDLYTATYGAAGKDVGDWLLYGAPSNLLGANLYTRGDINPRHVTVIPTNIADIPIVAASANFFGNLKETTSKLGAGGNVWQTVLQGLEHNGLSRPLAGLAQTLQAADGGQVMATNKKGDITGANDLVSLMTLARLGGAKPFDEAVANDAAFRISAYKAADHEKKKKLAETIKSTLVSGEEPSSEQMQEFVSKYVELGGKQQNFNKHVMDLYAQSNTAQANKIATDLNSPYAQSMQRILGGHLIQDGMYGREVE